MNTPTYKEQFDKITEAYIKGEIEPYRANFCFCGTLCDNSSSWFGICEVEHHNYKHYNGEEYVMMEVALLDTLRDVDRVDIEWEDKLFEGMVAALEVLKEIHISKGEIIDETPKFSKRELLKL